MALLARITRGIIGITRSAANADPVDDDQLNDRRRICAGCDMATSRKNLSHLGTYGLTTMSTCRICHCNVHLKTRLADESCPLNKWPAVS